MSCYTDEMRSVENSYANACTTSSIAANFQNSEQYASDYPKVDEMSFSQRPF